MLPEGPRQVWVTVIGVSISVFITVMQVRLRRVEVWTPVDGVRVMRTLGVGTGKKKRVEKHSLSIQQINQFSFCTSTNEPPC